MDRPECETFSAVGRHMLEMWRLATKVDSNKQALLSHVGVSVDRLSRDQNKILKSSQKRPKTIDSNNGLCLQVNVMRRSFTLFHIQVLLHQRLLQGVELLLHGENLVFLILQ